MGKRADWKAIVTLTDDSKTSNLTASTNLPKLFKNEIHYCINRLPFKAFYAVPTFEEIDKVEQNA